MTAKSPPPTPRELVLIVQPEAKLRVRPDEISSIGDAVEVKPLVDLILSEGAEIQPLYGVSEEWVNHRTSKTEVRMGVGERLNLSIFYKVTAPDEKLESLVGKFRSIKFVQTAYIKPGAELTIIDNSIEVKDGIAAGAVGATGDFTAKQLYLNDPTEGGIGVKCAWAKEGGQGSGVSIVDAEGAWRFGHEDLIENQTGLIGGVSRSQRGWRNHGTAVLGVISGDPNAFGVTGICPEAIVSAVSLFGDSDGASVPNWSVAAAIRLAADRLSSGDIILIEHHLPGSRSDFQVRDDKFGYIPIEWWPCNLAAVQYATSKGIIVVAAAGNGQQDLDDDIYDNAPGPPHGPFPDWWRNPFRRNPIDSGAIIVGAGYPPMSVFGGTQELNLSRVRESNFGSMVDAQGWGDSVVSCGYGGLSPQEPDEDRWYTSRFNGTSSAAAIVTGALGCLQGVSRAGGQTLDPQTARALLRDNSLNSPQRDGPHGTAALVRIGPRPNLCNLVNRVAPHITFIQKILRLFRS